MTDRQITHAPGCWDWGPRHYECAVEEIRLMAAEWKRVTAAKAEAEARAERLAEALREAQPFIGWTGSYPELHAKIDALLREQERKK